MIPPLDKHPRDRSRSELHVHRWGARVAEKGTMWLDMQRCIHPVGKGLCNRVRVSKADGKVLGYLDVNRASSPAPMMRLTVKTLEHEMLRQALHPAKTDKPERTIDTGGLTSLPHNQGGWVSHEDWMKSRVNLWSSRDSRG